MRHEVVRHGDVDCRVELDPLDRPDLGPLDLHLLVEMRLQRLPYKAVEPHRAGAAVGLERRIEPRQHAAPAVGRDPHNGVDCDAERLHQRAVEANGEPDALAEIVGEMVDGGVNMDAPAVGMGAVLVGAIVHALARLLHLPLKGG